jgi:hypothetical protein
MSISIETFDLIGELNPGRMLGSVPLIKKSIADLYNEKEIKAVRWAEMFE